VAVDVGEHVEGLRHIVGAVKAHFTTERHHPRAHGVQLFKIPYGEIEVQLLGNLRRGPRRSSKLVNVLNRETGFTLCGSKVQPVAPRCVVLAPRGRFVTFAILETEK
jgi:hypothetical protein